MTHHPLRANSLQFTFFEGDNFIELAVLIFCVRFWLLFIAVRAT